MGALLITGGAGFIGSNLVHYALAHSADRIVVVDTLTYAGSLLNLVRWTSPRTIKETYNPAKDYRYPFMDEPTEREGGF